MITTVLVCTVFLTTFILGVIFTYTNFQNYYKGFSPQESIVVSLGCNTVLLAVSAMLLAFVGYFRLRYLIIIYLLVCGVIFYLCQRKQYKKIVLKELFGGKMEKPLFAILILAAILYLSFPTYYMWSGRDYGIYVIHGIHTAETGTIKYESDQWVNDNYEKLDEVIELGYPAFYSSYEEGLSENPGDVNPQFLPLYWCMLSIGYNLAGLEGLVRITALLSLITLSVYYFFLKHFGGIRIAVAGTLLLAICPAQIWGARITQSEQMAQLLFVLACFIFAVGWEKNKSAFLYLATALVGLGSFCRMDNYVLGLGIACIGIYTVFFNAQKKKAIFWCAIQYLIWLAVSLGYGFIVHTGYFLEHWEKNVLRDIVYGNIIVFIIYFLVWAVCSLKRIESTDLIYKLCNSKITVFIIICLTTVIIIFFYFIRPFVSSSGHADSLRQYSFYYCPILLPFMAVGASVAIYAVDRQRFEEKVEPILLFIGIGIISTLLYTYKPSISTDHFFTSRRWIPVVFPFIFFISITGFFYLYDKWKARNALFYIKQVVFLMCGILTVVYMADKDKILMKGSAYKGIEEDYIEVVRNLPQDGVILTDKLGIAAMLHYVYDRKVYLVYEDMNKDQLAYYMNEGNKVYYMGNIYTSELSWGMNSELIYSGQIAGNAPECSKGYYPKEIQEYTEGVELYQIMPKEEESFDLIPSVNLFEQSTRTKDEIEMSGIGYAFFGPYLKISEGTYELYVQMKADVPQNEKIGTMEIVLDEEVIYSGDIIPSDIPVCISFTASHKGGVLQTRFIKTCEEDAKCTFLKLYR